MKKIVKPLMIMLAVTLFIWLGLTLWAESKGPLRSTDFGKLGSEKSALIIYDPDPFYNLDQQVCESFAKALAGNGWNVRLTTVASAKEMDQPDFQLYIFCANTYNWSPDWAISSYIKKNISITNKKVVAITLGAGSTGTAQKLLEKIIRKRGGQLIASRSFWLWKPNDQSRIKESNVKVAVDLAYQFGNQTAAKLK